MSKYLFIAVTLLCTHAYSYNFYGDFTWLYLKSSASNADLQSGTLLTLTDDPANLTAHVQELDPDYNSAFRLNLGCDNLNVSYFHFNSRDKKKIDFIESNQFFQNFLGGSFFTSDSSEKQRFNQIDLQYGRTFCLCQGLEMRPFAGISYADIHRHFDVFYTLPTPAVLKGLEQSNYWGVGPMVGTDFKFQLFNCLCLSGHFGTGVLLGKVDSKVSSRASRMDIVESFFGTNDYKRAVAVLNSSLALTHSRSICGCACMEISAGYEVDYYFSCVDRINPFDGYFNNPDTFPVRETSNLGLGGPYIQISITNSPFKKVDCCVNSNGRFYSRFTSSWLKPCPTDKDLVFATLNDKKDQQVHPGYSWSGCHDLGCRFSSGVDLRASYMFLNTSDNTSVTTKAGEFIRSINASGPAFVDFSNANSAAYYNLKQGDFIAGKSLNFCDMIDLKPFVGLRYTDLKRTLQNQFLDGSPPLATKSKFPTLKSHFWGAGPLFGCEPRICLLKNFSFTGRVDVGLLSGQARSSLDQENFGDIGESSNTLRKDPLYAIAPVVDVKGGIEYSGCFCKHLFVDIEGV